jgi:hypothetical protein
VEPFSNADWGNAFHTALGLGTEEAEKIFSILDSPPFGAGDGMVSFDSLGEVLQNLPAMSSESEVADPVGAAFAAFVDGTSVLEAVSFRHCSLGRLEAQAIGRVLRTTPHLKGLNLWGNAICDRGAAALAEGLEVNHGLQYLGLGRNFITHVGLEKLCKPLGYNRLDQKDQADAVIKEGKEKAKEKEKQKGKNAPPIKKDGKGRERYVPEFYVPTCELQTDASTGETYWLWARNTTLRTINLEFNPISDANVVLQLQPWGVGELLLRGVPCAQELLRQQSEELKSQQTAGDPEQATPKSDQGTSKSKPADAAQATTIPGWKLVLH